MSLTFALSALGLAAGADERDVRRAYARQLKAIDQEREPEAFQRLREAYEIALKGLRGEALPESPAAPPPVAAPAHSVSPEAPPTPAKTAHAVFAAHLSDTWGDGDDANRRLSACLADPRLAALDARDAFEALMVQVLAGGWKPGHQFLWLAALEVFGWEHDRGRLARWTDGGAVLDAAIVERHHIKTLPGAERTALRRVIHRLRHGTPPSPQELINAGYWVDWMARIAPNWAALNTNMATLQHWHALHVQELQRVDAESAARLKAIQDRPTPWYLRLNGYVLFLIACALTVPLLRFMSEERAQRDEQNRRWLQHMLDDARSQAASMPAAPSMPASASGDTTTPGRQRQQATGR